jgi:hypothetical protein
MQKVAMILSSMVDLRVRGGIVPAHAGKLDKVASWVNVNMEVMLVSPVAIESGLRFAIREGGRTVGAGVVTEMLDKTRGGGNPPPAKEVLSDGDGQ